MAHQSQFYSTHTELKLKAVVAYLESFLLALSNKNFETVYVDAFAGSGDLPQGYGGELLEETEDAARLVEGSAVRAVQLSKRFDRYVFIEKDKRKLDELVARLQPYVGLSSQFEFRHGDAADELVSLCPYLSRPNVRSVVFLDPFGSQVSWNTLRALGATRHVDLWYLFPAGLSVFMQMPADGRLTQEQERSFDRLFGPNDWRSEFRKTELVEGLFGQLEQMRKTVSIDSATRFMISCMKQLFEGGVVDSWLPLGRGGKHWYSLLFAMANPSNKAKRIGHDIAKHILTHR